MAVNSPLPVAADLKPVAGIEIGFAQAGIKKPNRKDVLVMRLADGATVAGVFTLNRFCAAPVQVSKANLAAVQSGGKPIRALVVNTGNANAGTGEPGLANAQATCAELAKLLGCDAAAGAAVFDRRDPRTAAGDEIVAGLPAAVANLTADNWFNAAEAIMTTDTQPKAASRTVTIGGHTVTMTGISKGAGMIKPNMATMLGYLAFDAKVAQPVLDELVKYAADRSFNSITIDGDTSTNDSFMLIATGAGSLVVERSVRPGLRSPEGSRHRHLAQPGAADHPRRRRRDQVHHHHGGRGHDPGRVPQDRLRDRPLAAGENRLLRVRPEPGPHPGRRRLCRRRRPRRHQTRSVPGRRAGGQDGGRNPDYQEADGQRVMKQAEILVRVTLGRGDASATVWTCDLSHDYVSINADYRS